MLSLLVIITAHLPFLEISTVIYIAHLGAISTLYNVPKPHQSAFLPLRSIPILKVILISYIWASISSFLPALISDTPVFSKYLLLIFIAHFLFIMAITLPFDIRDYHRDFNKSLITTPHVVGIFWTRIVAIFCLLAFTSIYMIMTYDFHILLLTLIAGFLIIQASAQKKEYYYSFFIDGTIILYFIIVKSTFV